MKKNIISLSLVTALSIGFSGCGGSSVGTTSSNFDNATLMNLSQLENYDLITSNGGGVTNLRTKKTNSSTPDSTSLKLSNILKSSLKNALKNSTSTNTKPRIRSISVNNNIITLNETTQGNVSGSSTLIFKMDISTGTMSGSIDFTNYKNAETNSCLVNEIDNLNGVVSVTGTFNASTYDINTMYINFNSNFTMDDMIWQNGSTATIEYNYTSAYSEDALITMTIEAIKGTESIGFKNFKLRSYSTNGYEYSYPLEGNIYIFTNEINGYFSVDTSYTHSNTPTITDSCGDYTYSGIEKYIGENSTLTWSIIGNNNYKIEIDNNMDGKVNITKTGIVRK